jgi:alpha-galactosidase
MDHIRFDAGDTTLVIGCTAGLPPHVPYWGKRLTGAVTVETLAQLATQQGAHGGEAVPVTGSLALEPGLGLMGPHGFSAHRAGLDWGSRFCVESVEATAASAIITCHDTHTKIGLRYEISCHPETGVVRLVSVVTNTGDGVLDLVDMATACLPLPQQMQEIIGFTGRWAGEFQRHRMSRFMGSYVRENRRGKTSQDSFPALILCTPATSETSGEAFGLHLAWSGNHRLRVDTLSDGRVFALLGALLLPGEVRLAAGESYHSPEIVMGYSSHGLSGLSQQFHRHVRQALLRPAVRARPRPVHYNTWEAVYFDHDPARLKTLATRAAAIGVERFVLDDGWFGSRRHDRAGLGDWHVSADVYPDGLQPLVDHVTGLGMEMGIWFEPEMVNPDSDLFRAHPDWILQIDGIAQVPFRHQYVLDISRAEVADYLFGQIDAILSNHDIGYIKWDMNRDLNHPGNAQGRARAFAQVPALYALIDRVRAAHPSVEIESCSSGGARPDYGVLAHTDRVWTSDSNDALDRQAIQRGASHFLPLDVLGSHVGPAHCHITGRTLSMAMRAGTALMGHMGLELNLLTEPEADLAELKMAIALYKAHRALLHSGDLVRLDTSADMNVVGVVSADRAEALYSVAMLTGHPATRPSRLYLAGLDPVRQYRLRLVWPVGWRSITPPSVFEALDLGGAGCVLSGEALMTAGMQLPLAFPETVLLLHLTPESSRS